MCYGVFEPMVMFFGLTNLPATFQTMMNHIFRPLIDKHTPRGMIIRVYMDDIIIGMVSTINDHKVAVHNVLMLLKNNNLYLKPKKSTHHSSTPNNLQSIL